jgi:8-oxo-dGTP diphosphatase
VELRDCVAFMLIEGGKILAEKRTMATQLDPGAVAIPGGHVEPGESWEEALYREAKEELGVIISSPQFVCSLLEKLSELYRIHYYVVKSWAGQIECHEAESILWIPLSELERLDLDVDKIAVNEYLRIYHSDKGGARLNPAIKEHK